MSAADGQRPNTQRAGARAASLLAAQETAAKKLLWLDAFESAVTVSAACKAAGVGRTTAYEWRIKDEAFALAWADIDEANVEAMEAEARRRAVEGTDKPVFQGGDRVGTVREYSNDLLMFLLKARRPDVYRDRMSVEHSGSVDIASVTDDELAAMTDAELAAFEAQLTAEIGEG